MRMCGCGCARLGEMQGQQNRTWTDVEDAEVDAAEGVETRARTRACGDASDDAEDSVAGEGEATLTRTRLGQLQGRQTRTTAKP